jgi:hypothetical protein
MNCPRHSTEVWSSAGRGTSSWRCLGLSSSGPAEGSPAAGGDFTTDSPLPSRPGCSPWALLGCGCGLVAGIGILLVFLLVGVIHIRERTQPHWDRAAYLTCQGNLRYVARALNSYARDHANQLPPTLDALLPHYIDAPTRLHCPLEARRHAAPYHYTPQVTRPTAPLITCRNHGQNIIIVQRNRQLRLQRPPRSSRTGAIKPTPLRNPAAPAQSNAPPAPPVRDSGNAP